MYVLLCSMYVVWSRMMVILCCYYYQEKKAGSMSSTREVVEGSFFVIISGCLLWLLCVLRTYNSQQHTTRLFAQNLIFPLFLDCYFPSP